MKIFLDDNTDDDGTHGDDTHDDMHDAGVLEDYLNPGLILANQISQFFSSLAQDAIMAILGMTYQAYDFKFRENLINGSQVLHNSVNDPASFEILKMTLIAL